MKRLVSFTVYKETTKHLIPVGDGKQLKELQQVMLDYAKIEHDLKVFTQTVENVKTQVNISSRDGSFLEISLFLKMFLIII